MRIWYDACTGKHVRYGAAIAAKLRGFGHDFILTTREHPDTVALARLLKEEFTVFGKYNPQSLADRLEESLNRQLQFCGILRKNPPDYAISHGSIDLCRVSFGLGVPTISTADSPHATAANRLALPLVKHLVISKAFPKEVYEVYGVRNIIQYDGVDEAAWIKGHNPAQLQYDSPLIVVREAETKAAYSESVKDVTLQIAEKLTDLGNVIFISRYDRTSRRGLIIPRQLVDTASLTAHADLVVGVGGTMAREASLQGTPTLVMPLYGRFHTNEYLARKGFPIYTCTPKKAVDMARKYLSAKVDVESKLRELENPVDIIRRLVETKGDPN